MTADAGTADAGTADAGTVDARSAWSALVAAALLGTDRAGGRQVDLPGPALEAAAAAGVALEDPGPRTVLAAAALLDVARAAGRRLTTGQSAGGAGPTPVDVAPVDERPMARTSPATVARLLAGPGDDLTDWLDLVRQRGLVVPATALPGLLRLATKDADARPVIHGVVGARGVWLAGLDPELAVLARAWAAPAHGPVPASHEADQADTDTTGDTWRLGDLAARVRWLTSFRRRDPAAAREALVAVLRGLPAPERARLLRVLATGLGPADEPVLEQALDDRAAAVRSTATTLLSRLPGSALVARVRERARGHLRVAGTGPLRHLEVDLPEEPFDAAARRDGMVEPDDVHAWARGPKAERLHQLLAVAPLDTWVPALAPTPEDLVALPVADDRADLVHGAWLEATVRARDPRWAAALLTVVPEPSRLIPLLPIPERVRAVDTLLRRPLDAGARHALPALHSWARFWPDELTDSVVAAVRRCSVTDYSQRMWAQGLADLLGRGADPVRTVIDPGENTHLQQAVTRLAERRQTYEETTA